MYDNKHILIISITLVVVSAFSVNTLMRLKSAYKEYPSELAFEDATHVPFRYVKYGLVMMIFVLFFSFYLLWKLVKSLI
jgi:hypothetical protein